MYGRSSSGRLRRPPQRWEGAALTGGVLARLPPPTPAETSTASFGSSTASDAAAPFDARAAMREALGEATRLREQGRCHDAMAHVRDVQKALISRLAASNKARHAALKRTMRKRGQRNSERARLEEAALRNAASAVRNPGEALVPTRVRLSLDSYLPTRLRGAPPAVTPQALEAAMPAPAHRLEQLAPDGDKKKSKDKKRRSRSGDGKEKRKTKRRRGDDGDAEPSKRRRSSASSKPKSRRAATPPPAPAPPARSGSSSPEAGHAHAPLANKGLPLGPEAHRASAPAISPERDDAGAEEASNEVHTPQVAVSDDDEIEIEIEDEDGAYY